MGGDDSQKLLLWRGAYSSPGRSKPPARRLGKYSTLKPFAGDCCAASGETKTLKDGT